MLQISANEVKIPNLLHHLNKMAKSKWRNYAGDLFGKNGISMFHEGRNGHSYSNMKVDMKLRFMMQLLTHR